MGDTWRDKVETEHVSTLFFHFSGDEPAESLHNRLAEAKEIGIHQIIASYKTQGMAQAKFDETYFRALDMLTAACREQGMCFWLEDYAPFPTGSANGAYQEAEYAERNKLYIDERHMDLCGPVEGAVVRIDSLQNVVYGKAMHRFAKVDPSGRKRVGIVACRLKENPADPASVLLEDKSALRLDGYEKDGFLKWDVPKGRWRIFVLYTTREASGRAHFMNLLSRESVALEVEKVHKPLYEHLKEELGKTWIGFFYDEPEIGNAGGDAVFDFFMLPGRRTKDKTDCNVYAWSSEMPGEMEKREPDWVLGLPYLWYDGTEDHKEYRGHYMDAVSSLVRENYNGQVYDFCRERGVCYIGHVLEDENCHTRQGCGPGHYFRQQYYQDEAGIDVIAGQILPGRDHGASWYGVVNADGEFYHYGLAKLASSEAHINPVKKNRAAAECFAMYGQQGLSERKFLLDHLLVNGVNRMLLAELPTYEASRDYAGALVSYTDRLCRLLRTAKPVIKTAVLYHAQAEWREGEKAQKFQRPGAVLARNQISYDVIPEDVFAFPERYQARLADGLSVNGNAYEALILPGCGSLPAAAEDFVRHCAETGFPVFFVDRLPDALKELVGEYANLTLTPLAGLAEAVSGAICPDIAVKSPKKQWIRYSHVTDGSGQYYLLHNEAPDGGTECEAVLPAEGQVELWEPLSGIRMVPEQEALGDGRVRICFRLGRYEMKVLYCPKDRMEGAEALEIRGKALHRAGWQLELPDGRRVETEAGSLPRPEDFLGYDFYGKLCYRTVYKAEGPLPVLLELGSASDCCEVFLNSQSLGKRPASPYLYDVRGAVREGENELLIELYTSGANVKNERKIFGIPMDGLTALPYSLVEPMGITGPVTWYYNEESR